MAAYMIAELDVTDAEGYEAYRTKVAATIEKHGGRYLARGGAVHALESKAPDRVVVLEFPDVATLRRWYDSPEYDAIKGLRQAASTGRLFAIEGL
jgi:uncharacterized protein (DUF1330 family)